MVKEKSQKQKQVKQMKIGTSNYPIGDFLIKLKNIANSDKKVLVTRKTNLIKEVAICLKRLGFIDEITDTDNTLSIRLTYKQKEPVLTNIKIISKPGLRVYKSKDELQKFKSPSLLLLSTSKGILSSVEAIKKNVGGEVLADIL